MYETFTYANESHSLCFLHFEEEKRVVGRIFLWVWMVFRQVFYYGLESELEKVLRLKFMKMIKTEF
jgi:hypothetical protein